MSTTRIHEGEARVVSVSRKGAQVTAETGTRLVSWARLRAAALQEDQTLSGIYGRLLADAHRLACELRDVDVCLVDSTGTGLETAVEVCYVDGTFAPRWDGHAGADEGGTQDARYAELERDECVARLERIGYKVRVR
jgi:hypothetical protein